LPPGNIVPSPSDWTEHIAGRVNELARRLKLTMYRFKACPKCEGDLMLDGAEWLCCQCGRYYYPKPLPPEMEGRPLSLGRQYGEMPSPVGAGRAAVTAPAGAAGIG